jgi:iron(III) transport system permease protein
LSGNQGLFTWLTVVIAGLLSVPVLSVLTSIFASGTGTWQHLVDTVLPGYALNTTLLVLGVGICVPIIGTITAWLVTMCRFPGWRVFEWALILPLAVPGYVMAYTYTDFLQPSGPLQQWIRDVWDLSYREYWFPEVRSLGGAVTMLSLVLYPYVYMLARAAFLEQSICALEVSRTLGCTPRSSFFRVALPLARPAIAAGTALALMETLADFGTVSFFGVPTFTTGIVRAWIDFGDRIAAGQLSSVLLAFVFAILLFERTNRGVAQYHHTTNRYQNLPRRDLSGGLSLLAFLACSMPLTLGFLLPCVLLLSMSLESNLALIAPRFLDLVLNSFTLAAVTAIIAVVLALLIAYSVRLKPNHLAKIAARIASMGYAVPGTVIAVGVLIPFARLDNAVDAWMKAAFGISTGLFLTGSITALVFAYLVRFMAISLNTVEASLGKIRPSMDDAARTLGQSAFGTLRKVHMPLMWGSLLTAGLMVFVDVMKELPATLVMRPFNFDTLAIQAHNLAADERLTEASIPSLTIVIVSIPPLILLTRAIARSRPGS